MLIANIGKLQENTAALCKIGCETLRVSAISGSRYVWLGKLKRSPLPSDVRIPDVKHPGGMSAAAKFRMWTSRWNGGGSRILDVIHPGGKWRQPDGIPTRVEWAMIPVRVEWVGSHTPCILDLLMDSKELSQSQISLVIKKLSKHQNLHNLIRIDCKGPWYVNWVKRW